MHSNIYKHRPKIMDEVQNLESNLNRGDYKILIVDDVVSNVLLLKILLTNEKFQVCTANNGTSCIEMARKEHPDLILLDVMMPDMNGFDTATILKKSDDTKDIPIIFLTALNTPQDLVHGFQVGASDFLTKPFNKEELVMRVNQQISLVAARGICLLPFFDWWLMQTRCCQNQTSIPFRIRLF